MMVLPTARALLRPISSLDSDALAYINAVVAAGVSVSGAQQNAINQFFLTAKADGSYSSLKCMYFPIWGVAAANAICLINLDSGTFNGSMTHASGYIEGDLSTAYFITTFNPSTSGGTTHNSWAGHLQYSPKVTANQTFWGVSAYLIRRFASGDTITINPGTTNWTSQNGTGIMSVYWDSGDVFLYQRLTSGRALRASSSGLNLTSLVNSLVYLMGRNSSNSLFDPSDIRMGAWWAGLKPSSDSVESSFTANVKTLWETCTGLVLP